MAARSHHWLRLHLLSTKALGLHGRSAWLRVGYLSQEHDCIHVSAVLLILPTTLSTELKTFQTSLFTPNQTPGISAIFIVKKKSRKKEGKGGLSYWCELQSQVSGLSFTKRPEASPKALAIRLLGQPEDFPVALEWTAASATRTNLHTWWQENTQRLKCHVLAIENWVYCHTSMRNTMFKSRFRREDPGKEDTVRCFLNSVCESLKEKVKSLGFSFSHFLISTQCLAHGRHSVNIYWMNKYTKQKISNCCSILQNFPDRVSFMVCMNTWKVNVKWFLKCRSLLAYEK